MHSCPLQWENSLQCDATRHNSNSSFCHLVVRNSIVCLPKGQDHWLCFCISHVACSTQHTQPRILHK
jgi:hypothetical protein